MISSRHCHVDEVVFDGASVCFSLELEPIGGTFVVQLVEVVELVECASLVVQSFYKKLLNLEVKLYPWLASSFGHSWMTLQDQSSS